MAFGGSVKAAFDVGKELVKRGHEVVVFTSDAKDWKNRLNVESREVEGMEVHYFRNISMFFAKSSNLFLTSDLFREMRSDLKSFDVIHAYEYTTYQNIVVHYFAKKYEVPYVLQVHGSLPKIGRVARKRVFDVLFGYRLLRDASRVIALTRTEAQQYRGMEVHEEKIEVIPNGIDLAELADLPPKGSFKKMFSIDENEKIVLYLGRIHRGKGIDFLIKAYSCLFNSTNIQDTLLVIAGPDDGYLGEARSLVGSHGLNQNVLFVGMLSEKDKISAYVDSEVVINVEPTNVFGLVPLEAAACSTPVVISKGNAISETIREGKFGFSVKYGETNELAEIIGMMLNNEELQSEMGQKGRKFVFENFNWTDIIVKFEKVYEDVVNEG